MLAAALGGRVRPLPEGAASCAALTACASSAGGAAADATEEISPRAAQRGAVAQILPSRWPIKDGSPGLPRCPVQKIDALAPSMTYPGTSSSIVSSCRDRRLRRYAALRH